MLVQSESGEWLSRKEKHIYSKAQLRAALDLPPIDMRLVLDLIRSTQERANFVHTREEAGIQHVFNLPTDIEAFLTPEAIAVAREAFDSGNEMDHSSSQDQTVLQILSELDIYSSELIYTN